MTTDTRDKQHDQQKGGGMVSIILATYNEREIIQTMLREILRHVPDPVEVIVVDDDSPDGTWQLAAEVDALRVKVVRRTKTRGLASAIARGIVESQGDIIGWMDADMCMPPSLLPAMIDRIADHDIIIGSRYAEGGEDLRDPSRVRTSRWVNSFARLVLGGEVLDYDSGFIVMKRRVLDAVLPLPFGYGEYFIEFIYRCQQKGFSIQEMPYSFTEREVGESKSAPNLFRFLSHGFHYGMSILHARLSHAK